jgi:hypothetical protein
MLGGMDERREVDVPWVRWPLYVRIAMAIVFAALALLMADTLILTRGLAAGILIGVFWGVLEVLVIIFPRTLQRLSRRQPLFAPVLMFGVLLYGLLLFGTFSTPVAVIVSLFIAGLFAIITVQRKRRESTPVARPQSSQRGRRHS